MNSSSTIWMEGRYVSYFEAWRYGEVPEGRIVYSGRCRMQRHSRWNVSNSRTKKAFPRLYYWRAKDGNVLCTVVGDCVALTTSYGKMCSWCYGLLQDQIKYTSLVHCCSILLHSPGGVKGKWWRVHDMWGAGDCGVWRNTSIGNGPVACADTLASFGIILLLSHRDGVMLNILRDHADCGMY